MYASFYGGKYCENIGKIADCINVLDLKFSEKLSIFILSNP